MRYLIFILAGLMLACSGNKNENEETQETKPLSDNVVSLNKAQLESAAVKTGRIEKKTLSRLMRVTGMIDVPPQNLVSVSVPLGGYLKSTSLLPGMHLKKGDVIAVLEDPQYIELQQDYLTTKVRLEMAESEYERQKELNASKASSDKVLQQAKAEYGSLKISLSALAEKLKLININPATLTESSLSRNINLYAPFNGYVSKVNLNIGKYVTPSDVIFELVNPEDIHLNLIVFEKDLVMLSVGQKLTAYTNSNPDQKYNCEIILISKDISHDRTAEVHCHFEKYDHNLLPGMYMNAEIELKDKNVSAIPEKAVIAYGGKDYLFIETGAGTYQMKEVTTGDRELEWVEVVNENDFYGKQIVVEGAYTLLMNLKNTSEE